jgi:hypothetical protein
MVEMNVDTVCIGTQVEKDVMPRVVKSSWEEWWYRIMIKF